MQFKFTKFVIFQVVIVLTLFSMNVCADDNKPSLVLVVNSQSMVNELSKKEVIDIYMGRYDTFPNGSTVVPLDFPQGSKEKQAFYQNLVGKSERKIKAYWSRLLFSGRATPPVEVEPKSKLIATVSSQINSLAYIYANDVTSEMKIVYHL